MQLARVCSVRGRYSPPGEGSTQGSGSASDPPRFHGNVSCPASRLHGNGNREIYKNDRFVSSPLARRRPRVRSKEIFQDAMTARKFPSEGGYCLGGCLVLVAVIVVIVGAVLWGQSLPTRVFTK